MQTAREVGHVGMTKAEEFLAAAELCLLHGHANASVSRSYYAMFHAAVAALEAFNVSGENWSHEGLQGAFARELIRRKKVLPAWLAGHLSEVMRWRLMADYDSDGVGHKVSARALRKARDLVQKVQEATQK